MKTLKSCLLFALLSLFVPLKSHASARTNADWNLAALNQVLSTVPPDQALVTLGDMDVLVSNVRAWRDQLVGGSPTRSAFDGTTPKWTGGIVYYTFASGGTSNVSPALQQAWLDASAEWTIFANLKFVPRTTQSNYVIVQVNPALAGGQSTVGMVGGVQYLSVGPNAWNRGTLCHEIGHTLGLVHEHQRSDRDSYVTIYSNNVASGGILNFVKLGNSQNETAYDFLSVMHYAKDYLSVQPGNPAYYTIVPLPQYSQYLNLIGVTGPTVLSVSDRAGMALVYGNGPGASPIVTNTLDSGVGSLRAALYYAFDHAGTRITFNIPTNDPGYFGGIFHITVSDQLPSLVNSTFIDGSSQPGNFSYPPIVINGANCPIPGTYASGLVFAGSNCVVHKLAINNFYANCISLTGSNTYSNTLSGCFVGINSNGTASLTTNGGSLVWLNNGAHNNTIGGLATTNRNVIGGSIYRGIDLSDLGTRSNLVEGNYIGVNATGFAAISNTWDGIGIYNGAQSNIIGGSTATARNVISGNGERGIAITDSNTIGNSVVGNYLGLNAAGTAALPNTWEGVAIFGAAQSNTVGGLVTGSKNVISGNGTYGVSVGGLGTSGNLVQGNFVGLNPAGNSAIPNAYAGVGVFNAADHNTIGGATSSARNIISGNSSQGVVIGDAGTAFNQVQGNYVGLDATGSIAVPNGFSGVELNFGAVSNWVGGIVSGSGNVISGNSIQGMAIRDAGTAYNTIAGNFIGLNASGTGVVANSASGVESFYNAGPNQIGIYGGRNFISGNANYGVLIDSGSFGYTIQGNTIGLNLLGNAAPNAWSGVTAFGGASNILVGGLGFGAANIIAGNSGDAIDLYDTNTLYLTVRGNSIHDNNGFGLADYRGAATSETPGAPSLSAAALTTNLSVTGSVAGLLAGNYLVDLYASSPNALNPQGRTYLGTKSIPFTVSATSNFVFSSAGVVPIGWSISATSTDPHGNTSAFSTYRAVTGTSTPNDGISDAWRAKYFGAASPTNSTNCAMCDADHDGLNNLQEFLAGTNPTNAASKLVITNLAIVNTNAVLTFNASSNVNYRVDYKEDLSAPAWVTLADQLLGTGAPLSVTNFSVTSSAQRFYRVVAQP